MLLIASHHKDPSCLLVTAIFYQFPSAWLSGSSSGWQKAGGPHPNRAGAPITCSRAAPATWSTLWSSCLALQSASTLLHFIQDFRKVVARKEQAKGERQRDASEAPGGVMWATWAVLHKLRVPFFCWQQLKAIKQSINQLPAPALAALGQELTDAGLCRELHYFNAELQHFIQLLKASPVLTDKRNK